MLLAKKEFSVIGLASHSLNFSSRYAQNVQKYNFKNLTDTKKYPLTLLH